jgi:hypothetical protein
MSRTSQARLVASVVAWAGLVAVGAWAMFSYELTPAAPAKPAKRWPAGTALLRESNRTTLLMFVHPQCPCSRASLVELERLVSNRRNAVSVRVLFVRPAEMPEGWERSDLWPLAERIPGATVLCDASGAEATRFKARTSGETMLFSAAGELLYDGGITASRGHEGDNFASAAVAALIDGSTAEFQRMPVFGCALLEQCSTNE